MRRGRLGACIGIYPVDAIKVVQSETGPYDETVGMSNITKAGGNTIITHLKHLKDHGEMKLYGEALNYLKANNIEITDEREVGYCYFRNGARGRNRTGTGQAPTDFKSVASTCSATRAIS